MGFDHLNRSPERYQREVQQMSYEAERRLQAQLETIKRAQKEKREEPHETEMKDVTPEPLMIENKQ
ncbi:MAG: hypothetical protein Unbinned5081contig1002_2 [Prokaryotic dsDNA virus sp.]|nr:MAG: hypothetical protein Unbinned5081contig1002_2 [Prokaryotic dsDNA virus sp.]|tara:strand:+ start:6734 stop:6931 length:198 start_codon:yes stop_codon:yes gene_type:complete